MDLLKEFIDCAQRETKLRRQVYPRLIEQGKMTKETADKEIRLMSGIAAAFKKIYDGNAPEVQQQLFDTKEYKPNTHLGYY